jgi:hypothetical protein
VLVRGPLEVRGTAEHPVRIEAARPGEPWGVLAVQGRGRAGIAPAPVTATVSYLELSGGSEDSLAGVFYSGELSVYHADLWLSDSTLSGAAADDALNVKKGAVQIRRSRILDNAADALDLDWATGTLRDSTFGRGGAGGDGLDVSWSQVDVADCVFLNLRDKCVSVGEGSAVRVSGSLLRGCEVGVASKDDAVAVIAESVLLDNERHLSAYRKKAIFGGGQIRGEALLLGLAAGPDAAETGSRIDAGEPGRLRPADAARLREVEHFSAADFRALAAAE